MGTEPVGRLLVRLSIPTVLAQLINMLYNIVDRVYIGHMPEVGSLALTGVGICLPIIIIVSAFSAFVSSGSTPRLSIRLGEKDYEGAEKIIGESFLFLIIISVILTAVMLIFGRSLLMSFGASENTIGYSMDYLRIYAMGTIFVEMTLGMNSFINGQGFTKMAMYTVLLGAILNVGLDPVFIYVLKLGVKGAAIATIISQCVSMIWCISFLRGKKTILKLKKENIAFRWDIIGPCLGLGLATFVMQSSESIISICFNSSALKYGGDIAVGAMAICTSIMQFSMLPMQGFAYGSQPIISYNYGAGKADRVKKTFKYLIIGTGTFAGVLWILLMIMPTGFARIFTSEAGLLAFAGPVLRIFCAAFFIFGIQTACQITFVSTGNAICSIIVAVVRKFILLIPMIYIIPHLVENHTRGVFLAEPIADIIAVCFTIILFSVQFKKAMKKIESSGTESGNI